MCKKYKMVWIYNTYVLIIPIFFPDVPAFPTAAYEYCFNYQSRFSYTVFFILLTPVFWLFEFLTIRDDYEPTGLKQKIKVLLENEIGKL